MKSRVKAYCARYDIEFSDLAKGLDIHKSEFSRLISGKTRNSRYFDPLCKALECSREWLLIGDGEPPEWFSEGDRYRTVEEQVYGPIENRINLLSKQVSALEAKIEALTALLTSRPCTAGTSVRASSQEEAPFHLVPPSKTRIPATR